MLINKHTILEALLEFAGPLGPLVSLEERYEAEARWRKNLPVEAVDILFDILQYPPSAKELYPIKKEDLEFQIIEALITIAQSDQIFFLDHYGFHINNPKIRPALIDTLGELSSKHALPWLLPFTERGGLTKDERLRLAAVLDTFKLSN